jgi:hypothetical protein
VLVHDVFVLSASAENSQIDTVVHVPFTSYESVQHDNVALQFATSHQFVHGHVQLYVSVVSLYDAVGVVVGHRFVVGSDVSVVQFTHQHVHATISKHTVHDGIYQSLHVYVQSVAVLHPLFHVIVTSHESYVEFGSFVHSLHATVSVSLSHVFVVVFSWYVFSQSVESFVSFVIVTVALLHSRFAV